MTLILQGTDNSATVPAVQGGTAGTSTGLYYPTTNSVGISTAGTNAVYIDASQNVGIGTSSPAAKLDVAGAATGVGFKVRSGGNSGINILDVADAGGSGRVILDPSGYLLVGGTTAKGKVSIYSTNEILSLITTAATGSNYLDFYKSSGSASQGYIGYDSGSNDYLTINNQLDRVRVIAQSAGVYLAIGGTSWSVISDERKKDIIEPISNAATKVSSLRAVIGKYKTDAEGTRRTFLIAQDVQAVLPEAVNVENPEDGTLGLQYTDVIPLLVAAIKEQQALITQLTDRIAALEAK